MARGTKENNNFLTDIQSRAIDLNLLERAHQQGAVELHDGWKLTVHKNKNRPISKREWLVSASMLEGAQQKIEDVSGLLQGESARPTHGRYAHLRKYAADYIVTGLAVTAYCLAFDKVPTDMPHDIVSGAHAATNIVSAFADGGKFITGLMP